MQSNPGTEVDPRENIKQLIKKDDIFSLLFKAAELHGHYCIGLSMGVLASYLALKRLEKVTEAKLDVHITPKFVSIVETNLCFSDGVQMIVGTTFGNNTMIFRDTGKQSVTVIDTNSKMAVRVTLIDEPHKYLTVTTNEKFKAYFDKAMIKKEKLSEEEMKEFRRMMYDASLELINLQPEKIFKIEEFKLGGLKRDLVSPSVKMVKCSKCGELVLESKGKYVEGKFVCNDCLNEPSDTILGRGILKLRKEDIYS